MSAEGTAIDKSSELKRLEDECKRKKLEASAMHAQYRSSIDRPSAFDRSAEFKKMEDECKKKNQEVAEMHAQYRSSSDGQSAFDRSFG